VKSVVKRFCFFAYIWFGENQFLTKAKGTAQAVPSAIFVMDLSFGDSKSWNL
jgi:hypothetical protein